MYVEEMTGSTVYAKVGLMYAHDYAYSYAPNYWSRRIILDNYASHTMNSWLYMGLSEWTIQGGGAAAGVNYPSALTLTTSGNLSNSHTFYETYSMAIRPSFYLNSTVQYVSGIGTSSNPIRIN